MSHPFMDPTVAPLTDQFEWQGRTIAHTSFGSGPDVVFNHGTPFSSRVWARYADALSDRYTVHLWDMPGYGASSKHPEHRVDFAHQADAFDALLDHWELDRPHVIAHDFGGAVALRETLVNRRPYASLFLVDPVAVPPIGSPFFTFVGDNPQLADLPDFIHAAAVAAYIKGATATPLSDADLDALCAPWVGPEGQPAFYRQIEHFDDRFLAENEHRITELSCPTRLMWAEEDEWIPLPYGRDLSARITGALFSTIPKAGHLVQHDAPVALAVAINEWLTDRQR